MSPWCKPSFLPMSHIQVLQNESIFGEVGAVALFSTARRRTCKEREYPESIYCPTH